MADVPGQPINLCSTDVTRLIAPASTSEVIFSSSEVMMYHAPCAETSVIVDNTPGGLGG